MEAIYTVTTIDACTTALRPGWKLLRYKLNERFTYLTVFASNAMRYYCGVAAIEQQALVALLELGR